MTQIEDRILEMLKPGVGANGRFPVKKVEFATKWEGYDAYCFYLDVDKNEVVQIGIPWFYLVKGDAIRKSTDDESIEIMAKIYDETDELDVDDEDWEDDEEEESIPKPVPCMISCAGPRI